MFPIHLLSVSVSLDDLLVRGDLRGNILAGLLLQLSNLLLIRIEDGSLHLSLGLKLGNNVLVLPSDLVGEASD